MNVTRPAILYYGSKWRLAPTIIDLMPPHDLYCEPFGGSAAVLLQKRRSSIEVYNDLDEEVVNFFQQLREHADELIGLIEMTPLSRLELTRAYESCDSPIERARRFYVRSWQSRGANARWPSGWRYEKTCTHGRSFATRWTETHHLQAIVDRLRGVQIECDDAFRVIARFDTPQTVFYVDPPYLRETRSPSHSVEYTHEIDEADHRDLAELLRQVEGGVIISSYPHALYEGLYGDWRSMEVSVRTRGHHGATEMLWISPRLQAMGMPLFTWMDN